MKRMLALILSLGVLVSSCNGMAVRASERAAAPGKLAFHPGAAPNLPPAFSVHATGATGRSTNAITVIHPVLPPLLNQPSMTVAPVQGVPGTLTQVSTCGFLLPSTGSGGFSTFAPSATFTISLDGVVAARTSQVIRCDDGSWGFDVSNDGLAVVVGIPMAASTGNHTITATWDLDGQTASGTFTVRTATTSYPTTVITFDDLPPGTRVTDQYSAKGVTFTDGSGTTFGTNGNGTTAQGLDAQPLIVRQVAAGQAQSGNQIGVFGGCNEACPGLDLHGVFTGQTHQHLAVYIGSVGDPSTLPRISLIAYDSGGNRVATVQSATFGGTGFHSKVYIDAPSANIASFEIQAPKGGDIGIDDLTFDSSPASATPDFYLTRAHKADEVPVYPGDTAAIPIDVERLNHSTGPITFYVSGLPNGVSASFTPNPTYSNGVTMQVSAAAGTPEIAEADVSVTGVPSTGAAGPQDRTLLVRLSTVPQFSVYSTPTYDIDMKPCQTSGSTILRVVANNPSFARSPHTINLTIDDLLPPGVDVSFNPSSVSFPLVAQSSRNTPDWPEVTFTVSVKPGSLSGDMPLHVLATSGPFRSRITVTLQPAKPAITGMSLYKGTAPQMLQAGSKMIIAGSGFCPSSTVQFGNADAVAVPEQVTPDGRAIVVTIPRLATDGQVSVITPDGAATSPETFTISTWRNTNGFSFGNEIPSTVGFDDLTAVFGEDQTWDHVDPCAAATDGVTHCPIKTLPNAGALLVLATLKKSLTDQSGGGLCFGIVLTAQQFLYGEQSLHDYASSTPSGVAAKIWELAKSPELKRHILLAALEQGSAEFLKYWLEQVARNATRSSSDMYNQIHGFLAAGDPPLIAIRQGTSGHVVLAYDLESDGQGGYYIDVYDPNRQFMTSENTDAATHQQNEQNSRIHVTPDSRWAFQMGGQNWGGGFGTADNSLVVIPHGVIPSHPTLPTNLDGLATMILGTPVSTL